jgi:hypothetical protein
MKINLGDFLSLKVSSSLFIPFQMSSFFGGKAKTESISLVCFKAENEEKTLRVMTSLMPSSETLMFIIKGEK